MRSRPEIGSTPLIWALLLVSVSIIAGSSADSAIGALRQTAYADTLSDATSRFDAVFEFRSNNHSEPVIPLPNMSAGLMSVPVDWRAAFRALNLRAARLRQDWLSGEFVAAAAAIPDRELKAMRAEAMAHLATSQRKGMFAPASGRSVPYSHILDHMPVMSAFYRDPLFISTLEQISGRKLLLSHETDPHAMTVYYYNRPGDFTGWHYDTSFYHGERLTVLVPLIDNSSCRLQVELHSRENEGLAAEQHEGRAKDDQTSWFGQFGVLVGQARSQQQQTKQGAQEVTPFDEMVCRSKRSSCMLACVHAYTNTPMHAGTRACTNAHFRACTRAGAQACMVACMRTHAQWYMHTAHGRMHTCARARMQDDAWRGAVLQWRPGPAPCDTDGWPEGGRRAAHHALARVRHDAGGQPVLVSRSTGSIVGMGGTPRRA